MNIPAFRRVVSEDPGEEEYGEDRDSLDFEKMDWKLMSDFVDRVRMTFLRYFFLGYPVVLLYRNSPPVLCLIETRLVVCAFQKNVSRAVCLAISCTVLKPVRLKCQFLWSVATG